MLYVNEQILLDCDMKPEHLYPFLPCISLKLRNCNEMLCIFIVLSSSFTGSIECKACFCCCCGCFFFWVCYHVCVFWSAWLCSWSNPAGTQTTTSVVPNSHLRLNEIWVVFMTEIQRRVKIKMWHSDSRRTGPVILYGLCMFSQRKQLNSPGKLTANSLSPYISPVIDLTVPSPPCVNWERLLPLSVEWY